MVLILVVTIGLVLRVVHVLKEAAQRGSGHRRASRVGALVITVVAVGVASTLAERLHPIGSYDYHDDVAAAAPTQRRGRRGAIRGGHPVIRRQRRRKHHCDRRTPGWTGQRAVRRHLQRARIEGGQVRDVQALGATARHLLRVPGRDAHDARASRASPDCPVTARALPRRVRRSGSAIVEVESAFGRTTDVALPPGQQLNPIGILWPSLTISLSVSRHWLTRTFGSLLTDLLSRSLARAWAVAVCSRWVAIRVLATSAW